jgi:hypothetical protein
MQNAKFCTRVPHRVIASKEKEADTMKQFTKICVWGMLCALLFLHFEANSASKDNTSAFDLRPGKKLIFKNNVFENGSSTIAVKERPQFAQLLAYLKARPNLMIEVNGYSDNVGNPEQNIRLSEARADAVRYYLVQQGIAPERIKTRGHGAERPIASNDTEEGKAQNRRIEVVALSSRTERPVTTGRNTPTQPDGRITALLPTVLTLAPWDETWQEARLGEQIYEYHRLQTVDKARAEITFTNKERVQIAENSIVMIYGSQAVVAGSGVGGAGKQKPNEQIRLMKGSMFVKMKSLQKSQPILVRTANGEVAVALNETAAKIELNTNNQSLVSVHEGNANVQNASGEAMDVKENFGTRVSSDAPPEKPRPLPPVPDLIAPNLADSLFSGQMLFQWVKRSPRVRFEVAGDITFQKPLYSYVFAKDSVLVSMEEGVWYVRLAGIDEIGLESRSSIYRIHVATPPAPFRFYFLTMLCFAASIGTAWWAWITRQKKIYALSVLFIGLAVASFTFLRL